jgi:hypothetical protein
MDRIRVRVTAKKYAVLPKPGGPVGSTMGEDIVELPAIQDTFRLLDDGAIKRVEEEPGQLSTEAVEGHKVQDAVVPEREPEKGRRGK